MKKLFVIILTFALVLTLSSCGRKNSAKNLQIESHKDSEYVIKYYYTKANALDFGDIYLTIKDEQLVNFYTISNDSYKFDNYQLTIGSYSAYCAMTTEEVKKGTKTVFTLGNPLNLITETDEEGYETANENQIKIYVKFIDAKTTSESTEEDNLLDDSYITITTTAKDLVEFIRNKEIKTKAE